MFEVSVRGEFSAAHRLREYEGRCEQLHGHNWRVEVVVAAEELDHRGIAIDFKVLKGLLARALDRLDHGYLNELPPFDRMNPTCEQIARYLYRQIEAALPSSAVRMERVRVWESARASCCYREP
jgi:6-pyruvoyltetrahydropterin/6-carboxytetrahydropterin synthase